jgi:hypothetical protein
MSREEPSCGIRGLHGWDQQIPIVRSPPRLDCWWYHLARDVEEYHAECISTSVDAAQSKDKKIRMATWPATGSCSWPEDSFQNIPDLGNNKSQLPGPSQAYYVRLARFAGRKRTNLGWMCPRDPNAVSPSPPRSRCPLDHYCWHNVYRNHHRDRNSTSAEVRSCAIWEHSVNVMATQSRHIFLVSQISATEPVLGPAGFVWQRTHLKPHARPAPFAYHPNCAGIISETAREDGDCLLHACQRYFRGMLLGELHAVYSTHAPGHECLQRGVRA